MKYLISIFLSFPLLIYSQSINDIHLDSMDLTYIGLEVTDGAKLFKVTVKVDVGQVDKFFNVKDLRLKDEKGKTIVFNSIIDALNFFSKFDYELDSSYSFGSTNNEYYFILKRNK